MISCLRCCEGLRKSHAFKRVQTTLFDTSRHSLISKLKAPPVEASSVVSQRPSAKCAVGDLSSTKTPYPIRCCFSALQPPTFRLARE